MTDNRQPERINMENDTRKTEGVIASPPATGSDSSLEILWARYQNMVAIVSFAAVVIAAPGNWKWACVAIACIYLTISDDEK